jgi:ADP-heptose:LPS heptosyltransferase
MKIAILNLENNNDLNFTLDCLETIHKEIISAKIDIFIHKNQKHKLNDNKLVTTVIPLDMDDLNIFNLKNKLNSLSYYSKSKYNIAIDTQGNFKSALLTYNLAGKTSGFQYPGIKAKLISNFYDETIAISSNLEKKEKTKELFSNTFGF